MAQTAPPGYQSNYSAILELIRYGFGIWTPSQMAALLFHAERSTAFGRQADSHSQDQATDGIYSTQHLSWVRGPSGISKTTWHRVNGELAIDTEHPEKTPHGVLRKIRKFNKYGKADPTEYQLIWPAIAREIAAWKDRSSVARNQLSEELDSPNLGESKGEETVKGLSQSRRVTLPIQESHSPNLGESTKGEGGTRDSPNLGESKADSTLPIWERQSTKSKALVTEVSQSQRARENFAAGLAIAAAIEEASGERPTDKLTDSILQTAERLGYPYPVIVRWIHDKCQEVRARGYPLRAGLLSGAAQTELVSWCKSNSRFVEMVRGEIRLKERREEQEKNQQMPSQEATHDPEFATNLLRDIADKKAAG